MNIEQIARTAITILKLKYGLPKEGLIAGGSIANIMWELVSGNKSIINDVDVFLHSFPSGVVDTNPFKIVKMKTSYYDNYQQLSCGVSLGEKYIIRESTSDGIFNNVKYESKNKSPELVIESFDINCVQVGYLIEEDKFYWTESFTEFLKTGDLKITNINTPAHTAIRILKKKVELNASLDDFEIKIAQYVLNNSFFDIGRVRFMQRYADMYSKNEEYLNKYFKLRRDEDLERYVINTKGIDEKFYFLEPISTEIQITGPRPSVSSEFIFYIRNIYNNTKVKDIWDDLFYVYTTKDYIDAVYNESDVKFLSNFIKSYPSTIDNLSGLKFNEQLSIIRNVINKISSQYDYETAIAVLENNKIDPNRVYDDDDFLLMGLSVRKKIKNYQWLAGSSSIHQYPHVPTSKFICNGVIKI